MSTARQLAEVALAIGRRRAALLDRARAALLRGDEAEALRCLRDLTGLEENPEAAKDEEPASS